MCHVAVRPPARLSTVASKSDACVRVTIPRDSVVVATKAQIRNGAGAAEVTKSIDNSLRVMGTDYIDVFNLHGIELHEYDHAMSVVSAMLEAKRAGKIRHIGITENPINDFTNEMLKRAVNDPVWAVYMVGFHMMQIGRAHV